MSYVVCLIYSIGIRLVLISLVYVYSYFYIIALELQRKPDCLMQFQYKEIQKKKKGVERLFLCLKAVCRMLPILDV